MKCPDVGGVRPRPLDTVCQPTLVCPSDHNRKRGTETGIEEQKGLRKSSQAHSGCEYDEGSNGPIYQCAPTALPTSPRRQTLLLGWDHLPLPPITETVNGLPDLAFAKKACTLLPVP